MIDLLPTKPRYRVGRILFLTLGVLFVFFLAVKLPTDPDLGWHLRNGEYLLDNNWQVPATDQYSHTMSSYPVIIHEWITDIFMFQVASTIGLWALSLIFAGVTTLAFWIAANAITDKKEPAVIAMIIGAISSITIVGARAQMITLLGLAILISIIWQFRHKPSTKRIFWLPVLFLIWANLHGGFASGLLLLGLYVGLEGIVLVWKKVRLKEKSWFNKSIRGPDWFMLVGVSGLSALATLINPYGWRVYFEIVTTLADPFLRYNIREWVAVPFDDPDAVNLMIYLVLLVIFLLLIRKKPDWLYLVIVAVFVYFGFRSWRNVPIIIIVSLPLWVMVVRSIAGEALNKLSARPLVVGLLLLATAVFGYRELGSLFTYGRSVETLVEAPGYSFPYEAVQYLKENPPRGNMFNDYNWGGYLIWQLPEHKVFIDGRAPSWRINGRHTFKDHQSIIQAETDWRVLVNLYNIDWTITNTNTILALALSGESDWTKVYSDGLAVIFQRE